MNIDGVEYTYDEASGTYIPSAFNESTVSSVTQKDINVQPERISTPIASLLGGVTKYTPQLSAVSGTFTSAYAEGRYLKFGSLVFLNIKLTIITVGTATHPIVGLPFPANMDSHQAINGLEGNINGHVISGEIGWNSNPNAMLIRNEVGSSPSVSGAIIYLTGIYQADE